MMKESCRQALERVYEFLDGELSAEEAAHIQLHFERCKQCYPVLQFCTSFQELLERSASCQSCAPVDLKRKIQELLKEN